MRLKGKVAIVTGASRGIGRAIAKLFAEEGAKVAANYCKSEMEASSLADEIRKHGGEVLMAKADISRTDELKQMVRGVFEKYGRIDILVNNAGIISPVTFMDVTDEIWDRTMAVNLRGAFLCSKEVAPIMLKEGNGRIINISSVSGLSERTGVTNVPYTVSKAGIIGLTRSLAVNLGPKINVNAICPGLIDAGMGILEDPEWKRMVLEQTPLRRLGEPEEVASAALFLASDESGFVTGEILTVAGGRGMR